MINGYPLAAAGILLLLAGARWRYGRKHKPPFWLLCAAGFLASVGVPLWYQTLASLAANKTGLFVLVLITLGTGIVFYHEGVRNRNRHHVRTPIIGLVFGIAALVTVASISRLVKQAAKMPSGTTHAVSSAMHSIGSAHAGKATTAHDLLVIGAGVVVAVAIGFIAHHLSRSGGTSRTPARSGAAAPPLPGGGAGRPPLPAGRRR
jgi:peptidoglycan/LPS O-acetylase OafA/YrhL